jgi:hypothetical protein
MSEAGLVLEADARRPFPSRLVLAIVLVGLLASWLGIGSLRTTTVARDWFALAHGPGSTVANVQVEGAGPAIPPFWSITISGDVIEAGRSTAAYRSHMMLWVEPVTGWVFANGSG